MNYLWFIMFGYEVLNKNFLEKVKGCIMNYSATVTDRHFSVKSSSVSSSERDTSEEVKSDSVFFPTNSDKSARLLSVLSDRDVVADGIGIGVHGDKYSHEIIYNEVLDNVNKIWAGLKSHSDGDKLKGLLHELIKIIQGNVNKLNNYLLAKCSLNGFMEFLNDDGGRLLTGIKTIFAQIGEVSGAKIDMGYVVKLLFFNSFNERKELNHNRSDVNTGVNKNNKDSKEPDKSTIVIPIEIKPSEKEKEVEHKNFKEESAKTSENDFNNSTSNANDDNDRKSVNKNNFTPVIKQIVDVFSVDSYSDDDDDDDDDDGRYSNFEFATGNSSNKSFSNSANIDNPDNDDDDDYEVIETNLKYGLGEIDEGAIQAHDMIRISNIRECLCSIFGVGSIDGAFNSNNIYLGELKYLTNALNENNIDAKSVAQNLRHDSLNKLLCKIVIEGAKNKNNEQIIMAFIDAVDKVENAYCSENNKSKRSTPLSPVLKNKLLKLYGENSKHNDIHRLDESNIQLLTNERNKDIDGVKSTYNQEADNVVDKLSCSTRRSVGLPSAHRRQSGTQQTNQSISSEVSQRKKWLKLKIKGLLGEIGHVDNGRLNIGGRYGIAKSISDRIIRGDYSGTVLDPAIIQTKKFIEIYKVYIKDADFMNKNVVSDEERRKRAGIISSIAVNVGYDFNELNLQLEQLKSWDTAGIAKQYIQSAHLLWCLEELRDAVK